MRAHQIQKLAQCGERLYRTKLKKLLEPGHIGEYVAIEVESGDYFLGKSDVESLQRLEGAFDETG